MGGAVLFFYEESLEVRLCLELAKKNFIGGRQNFNLLLNMVSKKLAIPIIFFKKVKDFWLRKDQFNFFLLKTSMNSPVFYYGLILKLLLHTTYIFWRNFHIFEKLPPWNEVAVFNILNPCLIHFPFRMRWRCKPTGRLPAHIYMLLQNFS